MSYTDIFHHPSRQRYFGSFWGKWC